LAATQDSPLLRIFAVTAPATAASRSASSNTRNGAFPPSSIDSRSRLGADSSINVRPTGVEPVNETLRSRGSDISGLVTADAERLVTTFSTPGGSPAPASSSVSRSMDSGVSFAGLTIIVQPAATAGPILRVPMASGKFHGVISRQGPTGCCMVSNRSVLDGLRAHRPSIRTASSANQRKKSAA